MNMNLQLVLIVDIRDVLAAGFPSTELASYNHCFLLYYKVIFMLKISNICKSYKLAI